MRYQIPESVRRMIKAQEDMNRSLLKIKIPKIDYPGKEILESVRRISEFAQSLKNNPELQFAFLTDLEILNLKSSNELSASLTNDLPIEDIKEIESILNENLIPYLEKLKIEHLWIGSGKVLENKSNPDRLRHCLISLRTLLEYLIDQKLAPKEKLKDDPMFKKEFKNFSNDDNSKIENVRIPRFKKIKYIVSQIEFGTLEEFAEKDIDFICSCYSTLCDIHNPEIGLTENQVKSLKVKTGIMIWLLAYIFEILDE